MAVNTSVPSSTLSAPRLRPMPLCSTVLPVPYAFSKTGIGLGALTMGLVAVANDITCCMMIRAAAHVGCSTYEQLSEWAGGKKARVRAMTSWGEAWWAHCCEVHAVACTQRCSCRTPHRHAVVWEDGSPFQQRAKSIGTQAPADLRHPTLLPLRRCSRRCPSSCCCTARCAAAWRSSRTWHVSWCST